MKHECDSGSDGAALIVIGLVLLAMYLIPKWLNSPSTYSFGIGG